MNVKKNTIGKFADINIDDNREYVSTVAYVISNNPRFAERYSLTYIDKQQLFFDCNSKNGYYFKCEVRFADGLVVGMNDSTDKSYNGFDIKFFKVNRNTKVNEFADWLVDQMDEFLGLEHKECYLVEE
ncbi:MAG: hypothetical protein [Caudoviricetes sp.]|nr:MAG: hypothetical protein [Caudoviricetes sp.]